MRELSKIELQNFNSILNTFNNVSTRPIDEATEKWILRVLPHALPLFTHLVEYLDFDKIERVTINKNILGSNKRIHNISFLKNPPPEKVNKYGRCNLKKQSVFYGAPIIMTALSEMKPKVGDLITKSVWKLKERHSLKICPIFHIQPTNGTLNPRTMNFQISFYEKVNQNFRGNSKEAVINLTKFIAYHFSKSIDRNNDRDYIFSAYFADKLLNDFEHGTIEGIYYPSVQERLSFENIAIEPAVFEKYYELEEVKESIVTKDPSDGGGGLLMLGTENCYSFDYNNGRILWKNEILTPKHELDYYKNNFNIDLS